MNAWPVDFHIHTCFSHDSPSSPEEMVAGAEAKGLYGLCVTEHGSYEASSWVDSLRSRTRLKLFRGAEIYTNWGHLQVFGIHEDFWIRWEPAVRQKDRDYFDAERIAEATAALGGVIVVPHPFMSGYRFFMGERCQDLKGVVAIETLSGNSSIRSEDNDQADALARRMGCGRTGGSDGHVPSEIGKWVTFLPGPVATEEELVQMLKTGGYVPGRMDPR